MDLPTSVKRTLYKKKKQKGKIRPIVTCQLPSCNRVVMHKTCTMAVKGMPQCKNSLANCANL